MSGRFCHSFSSCHLLTGCFEQPFERFFDPSFELKRAQLRFEFFQSRDLLRIAVDACFEPLEWCGWLVVYPLLPTPAHLGFDVLHRRAKEVTKQVPFFDIERVELFGLFGLFQPSVADELAHVRPVFLLYSGVVVFAVGSRTGECDDFASDGKIVREVPVDKLAPVVRIEPKDGERQRFFHFLDPLLDAVLAFVPDRSRLRPLRVHVGQCDRPAEVSRHRFSTVRNGVRFDPTGTRDVPMLGSDGDLLAQKCAWSRPTSPSTSETHATRRKQSIHRSRAHFEELFPHCFFECSLLAFVVRQPQRDRCLESFSARLFVREPDRFEHFALGIPVRGLGATAPRNSVFSASFSAQQFARIFALIAAKLAKLIQQFCPRLTPPPRVPWAHYFHDFFRACFAHF